MGDVKSPNDEGLPEVVHTLSHDEHAPGGALEIDTEKQVAHEDSKEGELAGTAVAAARRRDLQPPAFLVGMSAEDREALEKKLKRKIDFRLMPMIILMYILNYIDRNNISAATLGGLKTDLNLSSQQFSVSRFGVKGGREAKRRAMTQLPFCSSFYFCWWHMLMTCFLFLLLLEDCRQYSLCRVC